MANSRSVSKDFLQKQIGQFPTGGPPLYGWAACFRRRATVHPAAAPCSAAPGPAGSPRVPAVGSARSTLWREAEWRYRAGTAQVSTSVAWMLPLSLERLLLLLLLGSARVASSQDDDLSAENGAVEDSAEETCGANEIYQPALEADSAQAVANGLKCDFCHRVTRDAFWSATDLTPLGSGFSAAYNKSLVKGDLIDIIDEMCELRDELPGGGEWDFEANGVPPTAMMDFYQLWVHPQSMEISVLWNKDRIRSQGLTQVSDEAARKLFLVECDEHLRTIDTELVDDFSALLQKHQKQLKALDWDSRQMYSRMLSDHESVLEQIDQVCSILCDEGKAAKKAFRKKREKQKKIKKAEAKRARLPYAQLLKAAKKSKVLFPGQY